MTHRPTHTEVLARRAQTVQLRAQGLPWSAITEALGYPSAGAAWSDWHRARDVDVLAELEAARHAAQITEHLQSQANPLQPLPGR